MRDLACNTKTYFLACLVAGWISTASTNAQTFDGFQGGTSTGSSTTINVKITGAAGKAVRIEWHVNGVLQKTDIQGLDGNGELNYAWTFSYDVNRGDKDELKLFNVDGVPNPLIDGTLKDTQKGCWVAGGSEVRIPNVDGICVPTLSAWGLVVMALLALSAGTVVVMRRRATAV